MPATTAADYTLADYDRITGEAPDRYVLRVRDLPEQAKPREKLLQLGPHDLSMAELVAILWGVGTRKEEVMSMAQRVLKEYGEKAIMHETNPTNLAAALDIPIVKACQIVVGFELGRRYFSKNSGRPTYVRNAEQAYQYLSGMGSGQKEQLRGLYLSSRYEVIHDELISVGSLTANIVHPREVFAPALEHGAVAVLIAHNHPSGDSEPTDADRQVTSQLAAAGKILGVDLLDHLVITHDSYTSILENPA
jgi:DNA repair protein RadC